MKKIKKVALLSVLSTALLIPGTTSEVGAMSDQIGQDVDAEDYRGPGCIPNPVCPI